MSPIGQQVSQDTVNGTFQTAVIQVREGFRSATWLMRHIGQFYVSGVFSPQAYVDGTPAAPGRPAPTLAEAAALQTFVVQMANAADVYYGRQQKTTNDNTGDYLERNISPLV